MAETGYSFLESKKRTEMYIEFLTDALYEYVIRTKERTTALFEAGREKYEETLCSVIASAGVFLHSRISSGKKGKLRYIHFSYLLSGALSGEMLVKLDFYDERYYRDVEETDCFWNCRELFPDYEKECRQMEEKMRRRILRVQSGELSQIKIGLTAWNYLLLKPVMAELVRSRRVEEQLRPFCEERAFLFYGPYLDESEVIHKM